MSGSFCIACFGDSLTEGFGLRASQALPSVLETLLRERGLDVRCHNFGVSGDTAGEGHQRLKKVLQAKPDLCIVAFGANDFFLAASLEGLAACKIPALLAGVRCLAEFGEEYKREFDMIFPHLADRFGVALLPDLLALYLRDPMKVLIDQLHPNELGVRSMAEALVPLVEAELAKQG
jgi:acyl-CoA thioesterase-1